MQKSNKEYTIDITEKDIVACSCGSQLHVPVSVYFKAKTMIIGQEAVGHKVVSLYCISCGKLTELENIKTQKEEVKIIV